MDEDAEERFFRHVHLRIAFHAFIVVSRSVELLTIASNIAVTVMICPLDAGVSLPLLHVPKKGGE